MSSFLKELTRTCVKGFGIGLGLGVGVYGLLLLSFWLGWLEKTICQ